MAKVDQAPSGYDFQPDEVPTVVKENPFDGIVRQLAEAFHADNSSHAVSFTIPAGTKTSTVTGQLDRAAADLDVTIRRKYADRTDDSQPVKATIWATKKRAPKGSITSGGQPVESATDVPSE
jgi:hypothetical protein